VRPECREFTEIVAKHFVTKGPVLEIGSLQVDGQEGFADLRPVFPGLRYVGCDMRDGPGVDLVCNASDLDIPDNSFGVVVSVDTLEHIAEPWKVMAECARVLNKEHGLAIFTAPFNFPVHEYPNDYWRMTGAGMRVLLSEFAGFDLLVYEAGQMFAPHSVGGAAFRMGMLADEEYGFSSLRSDLMKWQLRYARGSHEQ